MRVAMGQLLDRRSGTHHTPRMDLLGGTAFNAAAESLPEIASTQR